MGQVSVPSVAVDLTRRIFGDLAGRRAALLGLGEPLVAVSLAFLLLGERFAPQQWVGAALFIISVLLIRRDTGVQIAGEESGWAGLNPGDLPEGQDF